MSNEHIKAAVETIKNLSNMQTDRITALLGEKTKLEAQLQMAEKEIAKYKDLYEELVIVNDKGKEKCAVNKILIFIITAVITAIGTYFICTL